MSSACRAERLWRRSFRRQIEIVVNDLTPRQRRASSAAVAARSMRASWLAGFRRARRPGGRHARLEGRGGRGILKCQSGWRQPRRPARPRYPRSAVLSCSPRRLWRTRVRMAWLVLISYAAWFAASLLTQHHTPRFERLVQHLDPLRLCPTWHLFRTPPLHAAAAWRDQMHDGTCTAWRTVHMAVPSTWLALLWRPSAPVPPPRAGPTSATPRPPAPLATSLLAP
jgi:hypothetical protein